MNRKKLIVALGLVLLALATPAIVIVASPPLRARALAHVRARDLSSKDVAVRERTVKKLVGMGRPAIDGVLPRLAATAFADRTGRAFVGEVRERSGDSVIYDYIDILPDKPELAHGRYVPGVMLDQKGAEDALHAKRDRGRQLVLREGRRVIYAIDLDDPAVSAEVVEAVRVKLAAMPKPAVTVKNGKYVGSLDEEPEEGD